MAIATASPFDPKKYSVLVVDDDDALRSALVWDLKRKGYQTYEAENGEIAFQKTLESRVDLVLTDIRMPVCDGIQLLNRLKKENLDMPVVMFLSGFSDLTPEEACALGVEAVYSKPFQRKVLLQGIETAIQKREERWVKPVRTEGSQATETVELRGRYRSLAQLVSA